jgi:hypothetical protein
MTPTPLTPEMAEAILELLARIDNGLEAASSRQLYPAGDVIDLLLDLRTSWERVVLCGTDVP